MDMLHLLKVLEEHRKRTIERKRFKAAKKKTKLAAEIFFNTQRMFNNEIITSK